MIEPIYINRPVMGMSAVALYEYAVSIGIEEPVFDMHVTLAYSEAPVDWDNAAFQMDPRPLTISGGERSLEVFDGGAVVLTLESNALSGRWAQFIMAGASWNHDEYRPHVTLGIVDGFDVSGKPAMMSEIQFGPEERQILFPEQDAA